MYVPNGEEPAFIHVLSELKTECSSDCLFFKEGCVGFVHMMFILMSVSEEACRSFLCTFPFLHSTWYSVSCGCSWWLHCIMGYSKGFFLVKESTWVQTKKKIPIGISTQDIHGSIDGANVVWMQNETKQHELSQFCQRIFHISNSCLPRYEWPLWGRSLPYTFMKNRYKWKAF
jgi:hypothetical protein